MRRLRCTPRSDWRERVERVGLSYHSHDTGPYWDESVCYELSMEDVGRLECAGNLLHRLCIEAAEQVIVRGLWSRFGIPEAAIQPILRSWERDDFSVYGRFDLAYDGRGEPKLLEYNADTPTSLVEAAVVQWYWLNDYKPGADQFNSIHERLIAAWRRRGASLVHFACIKDHPEDGQTVLYLQDTCQQAGVPTRHLHVEDIGWDPARKRFVDLEGEPINDCFKLYPWEWLWHEEFASQLAGDPLRFIEPAWKMLLSNKALLPLLWEMFPEHPNLLPAYEEPQQLGGDYVRKPKLGREGSNVSYVRQGKSVLESAGDYGEEGFVYQAYAPIPELEGQHPVLGLWVVDHEAAGLGIREDSSPITGNLSRFVPHFIATP